MQSLISLVESLQEEVKTLKDTIELLKDDNSSLKNSVENLEQAAAEAKTKYVYLNETMEKLENSNRERKAENNDIKENLEKLKKEDGVPKIKQFESQIKAFFNDQNLKNQNLEKTVQATLSNANKCYEIAKQKLDETQNLVTAFKVENKSLKESDPKKNDISKKAEKKEQDKKDKSVKFNTSYAEKVSESVASSPKVTKAPETAIITKILDSEIRKNNLCYKVELENGISDWFLHSSIKGSQPEIDEFHQKNPGAPSLPDLKLGEWKTVRRKTQRIKNKLNKEKTITEEDLDFLLHNPQEQKREPLKFVRLAYKSANLRKYKEASYRQRNLLLNLMLKRLGLSALVFRSSWIGSSVVEFYISEEFEKRFKLGMERLNWEIIEEFNPETLPEFDMNAPLDDWEKESRKEKLIQRLGFLHANSRLTNLRECILDGLSEEIKEAVILKSDSIIRIRLGGLSAERLPKKL
jgi:hypothetical protein